MRNSDEVTEETAIRADVLITEAEMLQALSAFAGKPVVAFTDEPTQNAFWLSLKKEA